MMIKKGQIILMSMGRYSDYGPLDHVRALQDFDLGDALCRFRRSETYMALPDWETPDGELTFEGKEERFLAWGMREGLFTPLAPNEVIEVNLGSAYSEEMEVKVKLMNIYGGEDQFELSTQRP